MGVLMKLGATKSMAKSNANPSLLVVFKTILSSRSNQRNERLGWMGDAGLSSDGMTLNYDMPAFHENFLRNIVVCFCSSTIERVEHGHALFLR